MIPLDIIPTGWYHIGWSGELSPGEVKSLKYFGQDLVAFRSETGKLSVLDAFCPHLGAHLGVGGKVKGDCIKCPYHGWEWNGEGENTLVPYQDKPVPKKMRSWPSDEKHGMMFVWYDPKSGAPRWDVPDLFSIFAENKKTEQDFYPCYPNAIVNKPGEPFPVQYMMENAADTAHFEFTHGAPMSPKLLTFSTDSGRWESDMGFTSPKTKEIALHMYAYKPNVGLAYTYFEGKFPYLLLLSGTPIDAHTTDMRVSYFLPRDKNSPDTMPKHILDFAASTDELYEEDARMWRVQQFQQKPIFAAQDVAGYSAFRKWCEGFYEGHPTETTGARF